MVRKLLFSFSLSLQMYKETIAIYAILFALLLDPITIKAEKPQFLRYTWKYNTISHALLKMEEDVSNLPTSDKIKFFDERYLLLDNLLDTSIVHLNPITQLNFLSEQERATRIFDQIHVTLLNLNFLVCINTETFFEGLTKRKINIPACKLFFAPDNIDHSIDKHYIMDCNNLACQIRMNARELDYIRKNPNNDYFMIDCDIGGLLYLAIGEVNNLPFRLVEIPGHNFVRWRITESEYINWDNNSAKVYTNYDFRNGLTTTSTSKFNSAEEKRGYFLQDMTKDEIIGYYYTTTAAILKKQKRYKEAEEHFEEAIKIRPYSSLALNNLSWMYLTVKEFKDELKYRKALRLSEIVDVLSPNDQNYKDTYSCACAAVGDFEKAIEIEKQAFNNSDKIDGYKNKKTCLDMGLQ